MRYSSPARTSRSRRQGEIFLLADLGIAAAHAMPCGKLVLLDPALLGTQGARPAQWAYFGGAS
jgi:hypothetical protein